MRSSMIGADLRKVDFTAASMQGAVRWMRPYLHGARFACA